LRFAELHPKDYAQLHKEFAGDPRVTATREDGYTLLASELPPRERRGVVTIDPNFERAEEGARLIEALARALARFRHGTYVIWLPLAGKLDVPRFERAYLAIGPPKTLAVEITPTTPAPGAIASAVWIVNPPFQAVRAIEDAARYLHAATSWLVPE
jgi:23S rRNA (adenine2030-N6)-methyltransferase